MNSPRSFASSASLRSIGSLRTARCWLGCFVAFSVSFTGFAAEPVFMDFTNSPPSVSEPIPESPREQFNLGTRKLIAGKLGEAETLFQQSLQSQEERFQVPALFNLGHTRFGQGQEQLKKSPDGNLSAARGRAAAQWGDAAAARARTALEGNDLQEMVAAYMNGRGARRALKSATDAVRTALDLHGTTLRKWQRAAQDFRSAAELNPADTNALHNAQLVEQEIAKLVDSIRQMQQAMQAMMRSRQGLQELMKQLGGRIPEQNMPPGARGEEEEEEEGENGRKEPDFKPGQREGPGREGQEMTLSPEEAGWLLDSLKADSDRRLPMGQSGEALPKDRNKGKDW